MNTFELALFGVVIMVAMWMACDWAWDTLTGTKEQDLDRYSDPARPRMVSTLPHVARPQAVHDRSSVARAVAATRHTTNRPFHFPAESQAREKPEGRLDRDSGYGETTRLSLMKNTKSLMRDGAA